MCIINRQVEGNEIQLLDITSPAEYVAMAPACDTGDAHVYSSLNDECGANDAHYYSSPQ